MDCAESLPQVLPPSSLAFQNHLLSINLKSSVLKETWTIPLQSLPQCLLSGLPFQDHLPSITVLTHSSVSGELNNVCAVSPVSVKEPAIWRSSPEYNSTDSKSSVSEDPRSNHVESVPSSITKQPAISTSSPKYKSTDSKSSVSLET